ncbi:MAG: TRAP transporter small permease subunit [Pseudomonadota bacterium]
MSDLSPIDRLSRQLGDRLSWLFLASAGLTCFEVFMDSVFSSPTIWVHDTTIMMSATCFLFGGAYALQRGDHIRITFVYEAMPAGAKRVCDLFGLVLALIYLLALGWFVTDQAIESVMLVERSGRAWDFPMPMVIRVAFFGGTMLLILQAASLLLAMIRGRAQGWEKPVE